jgi:hypothetical protein
MRTASEIIVKKNAPRRSSRLSVRCWKVYSVRSAQIYTRYSLLCRCQDYQKEQVAPVVLVVKEVNTYGLPARMPVMCDVQPRVFK